MSLNRMLFKNSKKDDFILYLERTIETFTDDNIDSIGDYAFTHCSSLTSIHLPKVTSIGSNAFRNCSSLTSIDLPNVTSIGSNAFKNCSSLTSIHFAAKNKETIEKLSGFSSKFGATKATIYFDL